jgi:hypothetical protein
VETATMISLDVGYDADKQIHGRKRHLSVDLLGLVLRVLVTSASVPEREGAKLVLKRVHCMEDKVKRLHTVPQAVDVGSQDGRKKVDIVRMLLEDGLKEVDK